MECDRSMMKKEVLWGLQGDRPSYPPLRPFLCPLHAMLPFPSVFLDCLAVAHGAEQPGYRSLIPLHLNMSQSHPAQNQDSHTLKTKSRFI